MIELQGVTVQWGERKVLDGISWQIAKKYGLVGSNGCGKSTLLKVVAGCLQPDGGKIFRARYCTVGYWTQDMTPLHGMTLYHAAEGAFPDVLSAKAAILEAETSLKQMDPRSDDYEPLLLRITDLEERIRSHEYIPSKIEKTLLGLGFRTEDFGKDVGVFSGGWQTRILLARILLQSPSLLLLDEPTNHLDLPSLCWLENFLKRYNGAYILVSHDRAFLNALCPQIAHLEAGQLTLYTGDYDHFEKESQERRIQQEATAKAQQKEVERVQTFIDRFRYKATKAAQVQSRIKMLEKKETLTVTKSKRGVQFGFPPATECGAWVISLTDVSHAYGPKTIFSHLNVKVQRQDRIAIVGANGEGKSTLLRLLAQQENLQTGEHGLGHKAALSYFSQQQAAHWSNNQTVLEALIQICPPGIPEGRLRTLLGAFLFSNDDVFKPISVLSGGEKARLKLAAMLLRPSNCLLLDEPTNHLDMLAKDCLQEALLQYTGAVVIVSHDRAFLEPLTDKVWEVKNGAVNIYHGPVSYYIEKSQLQEPAKRPPAASQSHGRPHTPPRTTKPNPVRIQRIEAEIETLEKEVHTLSQAMQEPSFFSNPTNAQDTLQRFQRLEAQLKTKYDEWERAQYPTPQGP